MAKPVPANNINKINMQDITKRVRLGQGRMMTTKDVLDPLALTNKLNELIQSVNDRFEKGK